MKVVRTIYEHWRYPEAANKHNIENMYNPCLHYRYKRNFKTFIPSCKGGMSVCRLVLDTGEEIIGVAHCNKTDKKNFSYRLGRKIAYGRAHKVFVRKYQDDLKQQFDALPFTQNDTDGVCL